MEALYIYIIIFAVVLLGIYLGLRKDVTYIDYPCDCELDRKKCHQKVKIINGAFNNSIETDMKETFKCGKVKERLKEIEKML